MSDETKGDLFEKIREGFARVENDQPIRGLRANNIVDEMPATPCDEKKIWRASRKYAKTNKISHDDAREMMTNNPTLCDEWSNK